MAGENEQEDEEAVQYLTESDFIVINKPVLDELNNKRTTAGLDRLQKNPSMPPNAGMSSPEQNIHAPSSDEHLYLHNFLSLDDAYIIPMAIGKYASGYFPLASFVDTTHLKISDLTRTSQSPVGLIPSINTIYTSRNESKGPYLKEILQSPQIIDVDNDPDLKGQVWATEIAIRRIIAGFGRPTLSAVQTSGDNAAINKPLDKNTFYSAFQAAQANLSALKNSMWRMSDSTGRSMFSIQDIFGASKNTIGVGIYNKVDYYKPYYDSTPAWDEDKYEETAFTGRYSMNPGIVVPYMNGPYSKALDEISDIYGVFAIQGNYFLGYWKDNPEYWEQYDQGMTPTVDKYLDQGKDSWDKIVVQGFPLSNFGEVILDSSIGTSTISLDGSFFSNLIQSTAETMGYNGRFEADKSMDSYQETFWTLNPVICLFISMKT